jgi:PAS domain S-box-containing protein
MVSALAWPVLGSLGAAGGTVYLVSRLLRYRDSPGANWFIAVLVTQVLYTTIYGVGFLLTDPTLRFAVELAFWATFLWIGPLFAGFALSYTGRGGIVRTLPFRATVAFTALLSLLVLTMPLHELVLSTLFHDHVLTTLVHDLVFTEFRVVETAGVAGATFTRGPVIYAAYATGAILTAGSAILLFDTVVSYGPLYRGEAIAVGLSTLPPALGVTLWTFGLPPTAINLMPVLALPHVFLDAYAFLGSDMFEFNPATRRASERAAIDDVGTPVVIVDTDERVVTLNAEAEATFGSRKREVLGDPLESLYEGEEIDPADPPGSVSLRVDGRQRTFAVTATELTDTTGRHVGYTVVLQDVTAERQRKQRLDVLNRILRHNLRNDLSVVRLYADQLAETAEDGSAELAAEIGEQASGLLDLGEKARTASEALDDDREPREFTVAEVLADVESDLREEYPNGTLSIMIPEALTMESDPRLLALLVRNLAENGLEHGGDDSTVEVDVQPDGDEVVVTVRDDGPGVPEHELNVLDSREETALEHGSGLGLWLVRWSVDSLGGDLTVSTEDGTVATARVPGLQREVETHTDA